MPATQLVIPDGRNQRTRLSRMIRALWRYSAALWSEFYVPILGFLLVTIGGGWLYGLLYEAAYGRSISLLELPYWMLTLMVLQGIPNESVPPEPQLAIFWYLMPIFAVILIGRGAADFIRLFFNVGENSSAWEEAVASTYRNHVIVVGAGGHVGLRVIRQLIKLGYEIVGLDKGVQGERDTELKMLHVPVVNGDGRLPHTLDAAGIEHAQALVICTSNDQTNFEVAMRARGMRHDLRIIVRQWDNQFADQLKQFLGIDAVFSVSDIAAPVFAGAAAGVEIAPSLRVASEDYSMVRIVVEPHTFLDGYPIGELQKQYQMDIVLHERQGEVKVQPAHDLIVESGDTLVIFARHAQILELSTQARRR
ncbi:MAG: NAD-binding protein [Anaerolineae bacterium]